jgi:hypothetical protein
MLEAAAGSVAPVVETPPEGDAVAMPVAELAAIAGAIAPASAEENVVDPPVVAADDEAAVLAAGGLKASCRPEICVAICDMRDTASA